MIYKQATAFLTLSIALEQVAHTHNATPILYSNAPKFEFTGNTTKKTGYNMLCSFIEILNLTNGARKHTRTIEEMTETTATLRETLPLYETDETSDF